MLRGTYRIDGLKQRVIVILCDGRCAFWGVDFFSYRGYNVVVIRHDGQIMLALAGTVLVEGLAL